MSGMAAPIALGQEYLTSAGQIFLTSLKVWLEVWLVVIFLTSLKVWLEKK